MNNRLEKTLISDHLTRAGMSPMGCETYMGVLKYNGMHRRIDMKVLRLKIIRLNMNRYIQGINMDMQWFILRDQISLIGV
jgi:hypothetical protein